MLSIKSVLHCSLVVFCYSTIAFISGCSPDKAAESKSADTDKIFVVRKSDLTIGTLLTGSVNAKKKYKLKLEAGMDSTLSWIAEENSKVKAGDVVIKFDKEALVEKTDDMRIDVDSQEKALLIKKEEKKILESENKASIRSAIDSVTTAEESFSRYWKYDGKKEKETSELTVATSEKSFEDAKAAYLSKADSIGSKIYDNDDERKVDQAALDALKQKQKTAENSYDNARLNLKIYKRYTHPNKLTNFKNKLEQAKLNLEKVKIRTASNMIQKDNNIFSDEKKLKKMRKDLEKYEGYIPMMEIEAPVDGIFVYGDMDRRRNKTEVKVGMPIRRQQVISTIPDMKNLIVDFELPEQFRHKVNKGAKVLITPESMPTLKLDGLVDKIAMVPVNQLYWDSSSPKIYKSVITLNKQNDKLVSGTNVQIEVITDSLSDVVNIPVEAVFEEDGEYFVYLKGVLKAKKKVVKLGKSNDNYVHIIDGLDEGDKVYLYRPFEQSSSD